MKAQHRNQSIAFGIMKALTLVVVAILVFVILYVVTRGIGTVLSWTFWTDVPRDSMTAGGVFPAIVGTLLLTLVSISAACLIAIPAGIYMAEYAPKGWIKTTIDIMTNNLAGIPSIVFGLFGMAVFVVGLGLGDSILAGGLTLAIMVLPVIIRTTEQAVRDIPRDLRAASVAMGATRFQTISRVVLPVALPRIITGIILSIGRVAGETAPILFTVAALYLPQLPGSLLDQVMALPYHLYILSVSSPEPDKSLPLAFGTALILLILVLGLNLVANAIRNHYKKKFKL
jgi:phosphate transport system permease protein